MSTYSVIFIKEMLRSLQEKTKIMKHGITEERMQLRSVFSENFIKFI